MYSFGSDGASVMSGSREGVARYLKQLNSNIISIHCVAHRITLVAGQASQSMPYLTRFKEIFSTCVPSARGNTDATREISRHISS